MKRKFAGIFVFLLVLSGAVAAYGHCLQARHQSVLNTEQEAPSIHCTEVALNPGIQASSLIGSYVTYLGTALAHLSSETNSNLAISSFREFSFVKPFFQRNLYQFEQVYRL